MAPANDWAPVDTPPGNVADAGWSVMTFEVTDPPLALGELPNATKETGVAAAALKSRDFDEDDPMIETVESEEVNVSVSVEVEAVGLVPETGCTMVNEFDGVLGVPALSSSRVKGFRRYATYAVLVTVDMLALVLSV